MTARLARIVRHPIKAIGREELDAVTLTEGRVLPFDRFWAVAHVDAKFGERPTAWAHKLNFLRGVVGPELMAATAVLDEASGTVTLSHPTAGSLTVDPAGDDAALIKWLRPLWPAERPAPAHLVGVPDHAMTDVPEPYVSLLSAASLAALAEKTGHEMSPHRFRGNIWVEGWEPFAEFDLIGRTIRIGTAEVTIARRITRCAATNVDPATGAMDTDTLGTLKANWGHQDFGVYATVTRGGRIATGDLVEVLP